MDTKIIQSVITSISKKRIEKLYEEAQAEIKKIREDILVEKYTVSSKESTV